MGSKQGSKGSGFNTVRLSVSFVYSVRAELVEALVLNHVPFDRLRANGKLNEQYWVRFI